VHEKILNNGTSLSIRKCSITFQILAVSSHAYLLVKRFEGHFDALAGLAVASAVPPTCCSVALRIAFWASPTCLDSTQGFNALFFGS
jgi:hypothetical protein